MCWQNRANYVANGVETPPPAASEASGGDPLGQLAAAAAAMQIQREPQTVTCMLSPTGEYVPFEPRSAVAEQASVEAALQSGAAQQPAAEQQRAEGRSARERSRSASRESTRSGVSSHMRKDRRLMGQAGAPDKVAELMVRINVPLAVLSTMGASWACSMCEDNSV